MAYEAILFEVKDKIAIITLNRPDKKNAWNMKMSDEIDETLKLCNENDDVRAIVITGQGKVFCSGLDMTGDESGQKDSDSGGFLKVLPWRINKPVIAAINGHAIGIGITFAMTCDMRLVAEDAKIQFAFVRRGFIPELGSHAIVSRIAGFSRAADLMLTGRTVSGKEFSDMGLATAALPADQVLDAALESAREFKYTAPVSVAISKRLLWEGLSSSVEDMFQREMPLFWWTIKQADAIEGVMSYLERRDPSWKLSVQKDLPEDLLKAKGGDK